MMGGMVTRTGSLTLAAVAGTLNSKTYYGDCCSSAGGTRGAGGCTATAAGVVDQLMALWFAWRTAAFVGSSVVACRPAWLRNRASLRVFSVKPAPSQLMAGGTQSNGLSTETVAPATFS